ncbi:hypothetical protein QBC47DRAFT_377350 [Echria macrotheca]|uniref:Uncharacterized protein n=1 Tax=Echria macrotheca TaxID=438768 RepID=A0AAJ0BER6_9PEZI|nr:hypothetical protein QBC47DRAFT_377350 [Echria macrotheca]
MVVSSDRAWEILYDVEQADLSHWGFTLYRTDYSPESEPRWARLIEEIEHKTFEEIFGKPFGTPLPQKPSRATEIRQELWEAFQTDFKSDKKLYDGMDLDQLRKMHLDEIQNEGAMVDVVDGEAEERPHKLRQMFVFLVADTDVLTTGLDEGWVKVVDAKYKAEEYFVKPNQRGFVQSYWGWWKIAIGVSHNLWARMGEDLEIDQIAPRSNNGAQTVVWRGEGYWAA